jgi:hypothetical protein
MAPISGIDMLLTQFGLADRIEDFVRLLHETNGFIAGGAALTALLDRAPAPDQDLDIWIPLRTRYEKGSEFRDTSLMADAEGNPDPDCYTWNRMTQKKVEQFFVNLGWQGPLPRIAGQRHTAEGCGLPIDIPYHFNPEFVRTVKTIYDFTHPLLDSRRKIQVLFYYGDTDPVAGFDLDLCKTRLVPAETATLVFQHPFALAQAEAGHMRITNTSCIPNLVRRLRKYYARGFVLVDREGVALDLYEALDAFD